MIKFTAATCSSDLIVASSFPALSPEPIMHV